MGYIIKINSESKQALAFLKFAKSLDFVKVTKEKTALAQPDVLDEDGLTAEDRKFITALSKKTKKAAAKRFYNKIAEKNNSL